MNYYKIFFMFCLLQYYLQYSNASSVQETRIIGEVFLSLSLSCPSPRIGCFKPEYYSKSSFSVFPRPSLSLSSLCVCVSPTVGGSTARDRLLLTRRDFITCFQQGDLHTAGRGF
ncbi:hypothetical protein J3E68DRAFT_102981 [Trichoderma sp. SZMC 28012]